MYRMIAGAMLFAMAAAPAAAHPKLLASMPAEGAAVGSPAEIRLQFSERLFSKMSGAKLVRADGKRAGAVAVNFAEDGKSLMLVPAKPLAAGGYSVEWYGVAGDTHRVTGTVHFTVR